MRLGVLGWPVSHSRSPAMHNAALAAVGLAGWRYQRLAVPPQLLAETVRALPAAGFRGANVTIPHKQAALAIAHEASERAGAIGAANTLVFEADGKIVADNTDAPALIESLPRSVRGGSALVLGAGGSARAAVWALLHAGAASVSVYNRTPERARALCAQLGGRAITAPAPADLLVNCTSVGLSEPAAIALDPELLPEFRCVVDFVYATRETALIAAARERSLEAVDGLTLLIAQGALSFTLFTGRPAPVAVMREAARGVCENPPY